ncbi:MAG: N-acetylmuramoyl-L-alanine amidase [Ruminococcus sp.]|nr:N-acetylmuramoyl-L-alanine amidase [Ruminococcus sp.]
MKKYFSLILLVVMILSVAACDSSADTEKPTVYVSTTYSETGTTPSQTQTKAEETSTKKQGKLSGFKILLDAGHGCTKTYTEQIAPGSDATTVESPNTGTTGVSTGKSEAELTLAIALKLQKRLKKLGATVYMVRSTEGTTLSLRQRAEMGNEKQVDLVLRIHADGVDDSSVQGASLLYPSTDYTEKEICESSKWAAECILEEYISATELNNRGTVERNDLVGFNYTEVPSVLIELGFMTNPQEDELMWKTDFQNKMTDGICKGILNYAKK